MLNISLPKTNSTADGSFGEKDVISLVSGLPRSVKVDMNHEMHNWIR